MDANRIVLTRKVNDRERYYAMALDATLLGDWCLEREWGATRNRKPTGRREEFFASLDLAKKKIAVIAQEKAQKGYKQKQGHSDG